MTLTIDLQDQLDRIDERMAGIRDDGEQLQTEIADLEEYDDLDQDQRDRLVEARSEYASLEEQYEELRETRQTVNQKITEWDGSEFEVKEPMWGDMARINDRVRAATLEDNSDDPRSKTGVRKVHTVNVLVKSTPPNAPAHAREYPPAIGLHLYERIDNWTRFGDNGDDSGNSLSQELAQTA